MIGVAHEIAEIGYEVPSDVAGALDQAEALVFDVAQRRTSDTVRSLKDLLTESLERLDHLYDRGETITGVPTGYSELDYLLSGLQPSNLVVVGARPSMGKTAFALGLAAHAASNHGVPVLFFSLEMSHLEIAQRVLAAEARLDVTKLRNGRLLDSDWPRISSAIGRIDTAPLFIDDNPNVTIMDIRAKARRMRSSDGIGLVVIDYLQLMTGRTSAENRQVEISEISRGLKILARELQLPVVALSQLSRGLEAAGGQAADACRPPRKRRHRAGCRRRDVHLPGRGLQPGLGRPRDGRGAGRQAPERPDRFRSPRFHRATTQSSGTWPESDTGSTRRSAGWVNEASSRRGCNLQCRARRTLRWRVARS